MDSNCNNTYKKVLKPTLSHGKKINSREIKKVKTRVSDTRQKEKGVKDSKILPRVDKWVVLFTKTETRKDE